MFLDNPVANAQAQARAFTDVFGRIKRLENPVWLLEPGAGILEFKGDMLPAGPHSCNKFSRRTIGTRLVHHGIERVVNDIQENLFYLMWITGDGRQAGSDITLELDAVDFHVIVPKQKRFFEDLDDIEFV